MDYWRFRAGRLHGQLIPPIAPFIQFQVQSQPYLYITLVIEAPVDRGTPPRGPPNFSSPPPEISIFSSDFGHFNFKNMRKNVFFFILAEKT